jgi:CxxC-x17-CxxC domain-containing protein
MAELFDAICSACGCETRVPFQPRPGGKPVLCRECYRHEKDQEAGRKAAEDAAQPRLFDDQGHAQASTPTQARPATRPQANPPDVQTTSLAIRSVGKSESLALAQNQQAEITWMEVQVEPQMTYRLPGGQAGVNSNVWDFVGGLRGMSFSAPRVVEHTDSRAVVEVTATYLNNQGRQVSDTEVYEIDCARMMQHKRLTWSKGKALEEAPVYDDAGNLVDFRRKLPPAAEKDIWEDFISLKRHKLAKAITCAHRRLVQRAVGTKTLNPGSLTLMFPSIRQHFTDVQIQEAVSSVYGEEDYDPSPQVHQVYGEIVEEPPPQEPAPVQQDQAPAPADDEKAIRNELYRAVFGLARKCGDKGESAVRDRLAEWGCCAVGDDGRPSLRASTIDQVRDAIAWYEALLQEQELAEQTPF